MAQWVRAYCGETHETKIADAEHSFRLAAAAFAEAPMTEKADKRKQLEQLANRVLACRLKAWKARVSAMKRYGLKARAPTDVSHLEARMAELQDRGIAAILEEFNVPHI